MHTRRSASSGDGWTETLKGHEFLFYKGQKSFTKFVVQIYSICIIKAEGIVSPLCFLSCHSHVRYKFSEFVCKASTQSTFTSSLQP